MKSSVSACLAVALFLCTVLAFQITVTEELKTNPPGFFCDEASRGVDAWSLLTTGKDRAGKSWPLVLSALGEPVPALFVYSAIPVVWVAGLSEWSIRLVSALWGGIAVCFFWAIAARLFQSKVLSAAITILYAFSAWHWHFSRVGTEWMCFPAMFLTSFYFYLSFVSRPSRFWISGLLWGLTLSTYLPAVAIVPVMVSVLLLTSWWEGQLTKGGVAGFFAAFIVGALPAIIGTLSGDLLKRFWSISGLNSRAIDKDLILTWSGRYFDHFSSRFLLIQGDAFGRNLASGFGLITYPMLVLSLIGVLTLLWKFTPTIKSVGILFWLFVAYPLGGMLTSDGPSDVRDIIGAPIFPLLCGFGIVGTSRFLQYMGTGENKSRIATSILMCCAVAWSLCVFVRYRNVYFDEYAKRQALSGEGWQFGVRGALEAFETHQSEFKTFYLTHFSLNAPDIFLDFYLESPLRERVSIGDLSRYRFGESQLFAIRPSSYQADSMRVIKKVVAPNGEVAFYVVALDGVKPSNFKWQLTRGLVSPFDSSNSFKPPPTLGEISKVLGFTSELPSEVVEDSLPLQIKTRPEMQKECAVLTTEVSVAHEITINLRAGGDDRILVYVNSMLALDGSHDHRFEPESYRGGAELKKGTNQITVISCNDSGEWYHFFRIVDGVGNSLTPAELANR